MFGEANKKGKKKNAFINQNYYIIINDRFNYRSAKRHSVLGGLIAVLPVNILLAMFWLYIERKDIALLGEFSKSALLGLIPLAIFLVLVTLLFKKSQGFTPTIFVGVFALALFAFIQYKFMASM
jgi:hypothetical protein